MGDWQGSNEQGEYCSTGSGPAAIRSLRTAT